MDRDRLADIVVAMDGLADFIGVFDLGARIVIGVSDGRSRSQAAARLTALAPLEVDVLVQPGRMPTKFVATARELEAARLRHEMRRAEWSTYAVDVDSKYATRLGRPIVIVSRAARVWADAILELAESPVRTFGTPNVDRVEELVQIHRLPLPLFVLDDDLDGTKALAARLKGTICWISSARGSNPHDVEAILMAAGIVSGRALRDAGVFAGLRILVVDLHDGSLDREARRAAPGAQFERAIGWDALERIGEEELDVVIAGEPRDVSLSSLARFVQRCKTTPLLLIACNRQTTDRMRSKHPKLARYFIERPLCAEDLVRVLRR